MSVSYSLVASAVADVCALSSVIIFLFSRPRRFELPTAEAGEHGEIIQGEDHKDPFDIATREDTIDGYPLHEEKFWSQVKAIKLGQTIAISLCLALVCAHGGWYITTNDLKTWDVDLWPLCLQAIFFVYLLVLSVCSLHTRDVSVHWNLTVHCSALSALVWTALLIAKVLPRTPRFAAQSQGPSSPETWMEWLVLFFLLAVVIISSTTNRAPPVYFPPERVYLSKSLGSLAPETRNNVVGEVQASVASVLLFSYVTPIVMLGYHATSMEIRDLPILTGNMRAPHIYSTMRSIMRRIKLARRWKGKPGSGYELLYQLVYANRGMFLLQIFLSATSAALYYAPAWFLRELVKFLEVTRSTDKSQDIDRAWGWMYCGGLLLSGMLVYLITGQLWSISTTTLQLRLKIQLNTTLFAKTLIRKDIASAGSASSNAPSRPSTPGGDVGNSNESKEDPVEDDFSSKAQVHTLMTTDVDRVSEFSWHFFSLVDAPIEIIIGTFFLYNLLGVSCFFGLAVTCFFLPMNHFASKVVIDAQDNLMKARDERVALMNEVLGAMRMLKFMAWERSFEDRVLKIRERELMHQKRNYLIETLFNAIWNSTPVILNYVRPLACVSFFHFAVIRKEVLTPSIAFTSLTVFNEMRFALNTLPETFINILQSLVSLRRIEKYLSATEIADVRSIQDTELEDSVKLVSATISWPQTRFGGASSAPSVAPTPKARFTISDISLEFPDGELSLICGSGKTLLLLALLGEADILAGQLIAPRSPPDALAKLSQEGNLDNSNWVVRGICAYVPQTAWLQNDSIKNNIIFGLPFNAERYRQTIEACALVTDFEIIEDGDEAEIEGVNLSGGQKARVSLARAVYSRASILLLDDVLSALVAPGASYVVALDNGRVLFAGPQPEFIGSQVMQRISHSTDIDEKEAPVEETIEEVAEAAGHSAEPSGQSIGGESDAATLVKSVSVYQDNSVLDGSATAKKSAPRKLIEDEARAVGRVRWEIVGPNSFLGLWFFRKQPSLKLSLQMASLQNSFGTQIYWAVFSVVILGALCGTPVLENGWLRQGIGRAILRIKMEKPFVVLDGVCARHCFWWFVLYDGSIRASTVLASLLEAVLFANIRFHDTISKGRLLNRFGKDFEGVDSSVADNLGRTIMYALSVLVTFVTVTYVGGIRFFALACITGVLYYNVSKVYGQTSRDMRRLDSVTRSPLYSIYGKPSLEYYGMWSVNRWLSVRFNMLSATIVAITGAVMLVDNNVDASFAGFALAFASTITGDLLFMVRRFVGLEQSMVALERINEFSTIAQEAPEFIEPRPSASWPERGDISVENLTIRYAPNLPNVLHNLAFDIKARSKIGVLGRTGSGKSTLALSFFRFVEATEGRIVIDGIDISKLGLTDLRSRLTIIPQDPTILSGTLRTTLDVFDEYEDHEIALRRVHLLPSDDEPEVNLGENANVFRDLDSPVSEGGENFSAGEKQLLCMARAILKRAKVLFCDEATASVDYVTDELISQTIRKEFAESTIVTIAHRLRTIIDYDKVLVMDQGHIAEYDEPSALLANSSSKFYALCKATGPKEFAVLKHMAEEATRARQAL
ncbi:Multidrug resistance-associated ABC transporter [Rhizoctonia solani]|uniref:Multidrug resistance-associated ABC transporter n=1 Tax=Rhizoctonia solani TaxID=456999 RepID=A0A8H7M990_9AGAM|nr:Multidrug resistance-associated ABC transporter [Rhizoctonia solani]